MSAERIFLLLHLYHPLAFLPFLATTWGCLRVLASSSELFEREVVLGMVPEHLSND